MEESYFCCIHTILWIGCNKHQFTHRIVQRLVLLSVHTVQLRIYQQLTTKNYDFLQIGFKVNYTNQRLTHERRVTRDPARNNRVDNPLSTNHNQRIAGHKTHLTTRKYV